MVAEWNQPAGWLHGSPFQMSQDSGFACRVLRSSSEKKACFKRISVSSALINIIFVTSVEIQWATEPEVTGKKKTVAFVKDSMKSLSGIFLRKQVKNFGVILLVY